MEIFLLVGGALLLFFIYSLLLLVQGEKKQNFSFVGLKNLQIAPGILILGDLRLILGGDFTVSLQDKFMVALQKELVQCFLFEKERIGNKGKTIKKYFRYFWYEFKKHATCTKYRKSHIRFLKIVQT